MAQDTFNDTIIGTQAGIIVRPAAASRLVFGQQPTSTTAGAVMAPAATVLIEDAYGNTVTSDGSMVTLSLLGGNLRGRLEHGVRRVHQVAWRHSAR